MAEPCTRCRGDGMDPWNDYLLPCPLCDGDGGTIGYGDEDDDDGEGSGNG